MKNEHHDEDQQESLPLEVLTSEGWEPLPHGDYTDLGQAVADAFDYPTVVNVGGLEISFSTIYNQEACEGIAWSFDISGYLVDQGVGVANWHVDQQAPAGAPDLKNLSIGTTGTITATLPGRVGDQNPADGAQKLLADEIQKDEVYRIAIGAQLRSSAGNVGKVFVLKVKAAPDWESIVPTQEVTEFGMIFMSLGSYVDNNPTEFSIQTQPSRPTEAETANCPGHTANVANGPTFPTLQISATGNLTPMVANTTAPDCDDIYRYTVRVRAQNSCGWDDTDVTIQLNEKVPRLVFSSIRPELLDILNKETDEVEGDPGISFDFMQASQHNGDPDGVKWGNPRCFILDERRMGADGAYYTASHIDLPWTPAVNLGLSTGILDLNNCPLVNPDGAPKKNNKPYARVEYWVRALNSNTDSVDSYHAYTKGVLDVIAVAPEWDDNVVAGITTTVNELQMFSLNIQQTRSIGNWEIADSASDPVEFSLINPNPEIKLVTTSHVSPLFTGTVITIEGEAPNVEDTPGRNPSDQLEVVVQARNSAGTDQATFVITVNNIGEARVRTGGSPWQEIDPEDGRGKLPDYEIEEGDVIDYPIGDYIARYTNDPFFWIATEIRCSDPVDPGIVLADPVRPQTNPPDRLEIDGARYNARVRGRGRLVNAPAVDDQHVTCTIFVELRQILRIPATTTFQGKFNLIIKQKPPFWQDFAPEVDEDAEIHFSVAQHVLNDPVEFDITPGSAVRRQRPGDPPVPPPPVLAIDNAGNVTAADVAPDIQMPEYYSYTVTARNTLNYPIKSLRDKHMQEDHYPMVLAVVEKIPKWKPIAEQQVEEGDPIDFTLTGWVENDPDTFSLVSKTPQVAESPNLPITVDRITSRLEGTAPHVEMDTLYDIVVRCRNTAGVADPDGMFVLRVKPKRPEWIGSTTFTMAESTTESFSVAPYVNPETEVDRYEISSPVLTSRHGDPAPTLTIPSINTAGVFSATASDVGGEDDAVFSVAVTAINSAGRSPAQTFFIDVENVTTDPVFTQCSDQEFNENYSFEFYVRARSSGTVRYAKVSGPSWVRVNETTGRVHGRTSEVTGRVADNPYDDYPLVIRATAS